MICFEQKYFCLYLAAEVVDGGILAPPKAKCSPNRCTEDPKEVAGPNKEDGCPKPEGLPAAERPPVDTLVGPALGTG